MFYYILLILLYFIVGAMFASFYCATHNIPTPPNMSEEDKNKFAITVAFWAILLPVKFVRRLYIAIRASLVKGKNN